DEVCRITPTAADQFILRQLAGLGGVGLLTDVVPGEILLHRALDLIRVKRLKLEARHFVEHYAHRLICIDGAHINSADVCALATQKSIRGVGKIAPRAHFLKNAALKD